MILKNNSKALQLAVEIILIIERGCEDSLICGKMVLIYNLQFNVHGSVFIISTALVVEKLALYGKAICRMVTVRFQWVLRDGLVWKSRIVGWGQ